MEIINNSSNNKCCQGCGKKGTLIHWWWEYKLLQQLWKAVRRFLRKLGMEPPFDPDIWLLGLHPKDLKSAYYNDTATSMFIAAQLTTAKLWNQPRCPSPDECIKKMWSIYTMEYYSSHKEWNYGICKWMDGAGEYLLSEISQFPKTKGRIVSLICWC